MPRATVSSASRKECKALRHPSYALASYALWRGPGGIHQNDASGDAQGDAFIDDVLDEADRHIAIEALPLRRGTGVLIPGELAKKVDLNIEEITGGRRGVAPPLPEHPTTGAVAFDNERG